jgi:MFS family permease
VQAVTARRGVIVGCALGLASGWNIANLGAIASDLADAYGIGLAGVGLFTTALFVTHTGIQVPGGRVSDRFGSTLAGLLALGCILAGDLLALTVAEPAVAIAARAVTGVGTGLTFIAGNAIVRESGGSPFAQGLFGGVGLAGGGLALAIVPQLEGGLDWRAPYWSSLAIALVAVAALLSSGRRRPAATPATPAAAAEGPAGAEGGSVLRDPRLRRLAVLYTCSYGVTVLVANWVTELLERQSGLSDTTAGAVGALTLLVGIVSRPLGGWVLRRHPEVVRPALVAGFVAGAAGTLVLAAGGPAAVAVVGGVLVGAGAGMSFAPVFTGAAVTRPDAPGTAVGLVNGVANFVVLVGTPLVGLTFSLPGDGRIGFALIAAAWLVAVAVIPSRRALGAAPA